MKKIILGFALSLAIILVLTLNLIFLSVNLHAEIQSTAHWQVICEKEKTCRLYSEIKTKKNVIASSLSMVKITQDKQQENPTVGVILLPLGLHIPSGVKLNIDEEVGIDASLIECKPKGCRAIFPSSPELLEYLFKGKNLNIAIVDSRTRQEIIITYSLNQFLEKYKIFDTLYKKIR